MSKSAIEWCDENWSPLVGCSHVSAGCEHCYAERLAATRLRHLPAFDELARMTPEGRAGIGRPAHG
jgi:protein gp37